MKQETVRILGWVIGWGIFFVYAVVMEANNFIADPRGISVKLFEAILELSAVLIVIFVVSYIVLPTWVFKRNKNDVNKKESI